MDDETEGMIWAYSTIAGLHTHLLVYYQRIVSRITWCKRYTGVHKRRDLETPLLFRMHTCTQTQGRADMVMFGNPVSAKCEPSLRIAELQPLPHEVVSGDQNLVLGVQLLLKQEYPHAFALDEVRKLVRLL